ncbi:MAG: flavodoxin family protein [Candidatus Zixiibacteriota bacterium]|nr:MAG: flavodoxin family protein [candidate division Zixibacteria bacterium]
MIKLLSLSGSPVESSSTDILLAAVAESFLSRIDRDRALHAAYRLHDTRFLPCEACGESPEPEFCIHDDLKELYEKVVECDCLLFGSPIYFDSMSAQAKMFVDRCNCFRPADFENRNPDHDFISRLHRKRPGAIILVGSEGGWFEGARRPIAGFFKWIEVVNEGVIEYRSPDFRAKGQVVSDLNIMDKAKQLGRHLAEIVLRSSNER